jgi:hypothetical protein
VRGGQTRRTPTSAAAAVKSNDVGPKRHRTGLQCDPTFEADQAPAGYLIPRDGPI